MKKGGKNCVKGVHGPGHIPGHVPAPGPALHVRALLSRGRAAAPAVPEAAAEHHGAHSAVLLWKVESSQDHAPELPGDLGVGPSPEPGEHLLLAAHELPRQESGLAQELARVAGPVQEVDLPPSASVGLVLDHCHLVRDALSLRDPEGTRLTEMAQGFIDLELEVLHRGILKDIHVMLLPTTTQTLVTDVVVAEEEVAEGDLLVLAVKEAWSHLATGKTMMWHLETAIVIHQKGLTATLLSTPGILLYILALPWCKGIVVLGVHFLLVELCVWVLTFWIDYITNWELSCQIGWAVKTK